MRALKLLPGDPVAHLVEVQPDDNPDKMYQTIDRPIDFRRIGPDWGIFFDDDFLDKKLPLNLLATILYRQAYNPQGMIAGPAIAVGIDEDGSNTDLPQAALDYMAINLFFAISQEP